MSKKDDLIKRQIEFKNRMSKIWLGVGIFFILAGIIVVSVGGSSALLPIGCFLVGILMIFISFNEKKEARATEKYYMENQIKKIENEKKKEEKILELNRQAREGTLEINFPTNSFYKLCSESNITELNNEFSIRKAVLIAEKLIDENNPEIELSNCGAYLTKEKLEAYFKSGEVIERELEKKRILEMKRPRNGSLTTSEKTFIDRAFELSQLTGSNKRTKMLSNLSKDYSKKIDDMILGEAALKQVGMIYTSQQKKESSWAIMGGIAEGIAGPAAGIMAASETIANNYKIREHNYAMRKASMDIMSGIPNLAEDRNQLEKERANINQKLNESKIKVVLTEPTKEEIWNNINIGQAVVTKNSVGILTVSVPLALKTPFTLDVPENTFMVVDGVLVAEVWFEDKFVDTIYLPLPVYGIPSNMTVETTLDGLCGRYVEYEGEYTVKFKNNQNLWIMEA